LNEHWQFVAGLTWVGVIIFLAILATLASIAINVLILGANEMSDNVQQGIRGNIGSCAHGGLLQ
jgi:hypothetical protein